VIDWSRVNQLRDEVGPEAFAEIAALFLAEAEGAVSRLDPAVAPPVMAADLHAIKGSALNLGFSDLADLCARGESDALAGQSGKVDIPAIRQAFAAARKDFVARHPEGS
jgi:HPt (histidine-containing phosphotransfer) domain-containing protein